MVNDQEIEDKSIHMGETQENMYSEEILVDENNGKYYEVRDRKTEVEPDVVL